MGTGKIIKRCHYCNRKKESAQPTYITGYAICNECLLDQIETCACDVDEQQNELEALEEIRKKRGIPPS